MSEQHVIFASAYEALRRVLGDRLGDEVVRARFRAHGVDVERPPAAVALETWLASLDATMDTLWPALPREQAAWELGAAVMRGYAGTLLGKALMQMAKVIGPKRSLERMARNLRSTNNYSETKLTELAPNHFELWINIVVNPHYFCGLLTAGLELTGVQASSVRIKSFGREEGLVLDVQWPER